MRKLLFLFFLLLSLGGCISDFIPEVEGSQGVLVVDGMITNGESVIKLSRSVSIMDTLRGENFIENAMVRIERNDGVSFPAVHEGNGCYRIQTGDLNHALEYRLFFSVAGESYQSDFLKPMRTAEIESISYRKKDREDPVGIFVSTYAEKDMSIYYRWSFKETWELKASLFARHGYINGVLTLFNRYTSNNTYYCWGRDSSKILILGSSEKLSDNVIKEQKLTEIPSSHDKISILYHIEVSQMQIRKEAYDYFRILQDEIERTGGLFNIVLSAGDNGNVYNCSKPDERVIGYVEVAETTMKSVFISNDETDFYNDPHEICPVYSHPGEGMFPWVDYDKVTYSTWRCVDCRERYNATKNKPSWWPTDHL